MKSRRILALSVVFILVFALIGGTPVAAETVEQEDGLVSRPQPRWAYITMTSIHLSFEGRIATYSATCGGRPEAEYSVSIYLMDTDWNIIDGPRESGPRRTPLAGNVVEVPGPGAYFAIAYYFAEIDGEIMEGTFLDSDIWYID